MISSSDLEDSKIWDLEISFPAQRKKKKTWQMLEKLKKIAHQGSHLSFGTLKIILKLCTILYLINMF